MATDIDSLQIKLNAEATKANTAIDRLVGKIDRLTISLNRLDGSRLGVLANGVQRLGTAMQTMNNVKTADFTRLAKNLTALNNLDVSKLGNISANISHIGTSLKGLTGMSDGAKQLAELASGIKQLGYKSAGQAIENIPKLAAAMKQLMAELSKSPKVSQNLIDMTNALAKLSRTGSSSGKAAGSLSSALNTYSVSAKNAKTHSISLASAIGKLYASYWLLFRAFSKLGDAIEISSDLTEVQNVVDVTFGKYASLVEKMSETSITDFGMSELTVKEVSSRFQAMGTAMGFAQGKMADMSIELTKLTADMASFYNMEQEDVAEDLESIFTGQTRPLRTYGLDLTEATLKEWALKNGLDANIDSMSQAEKTMLRYQYVLANTGAAQGDFSRTVDTWANQTRILKQNLEQLASVSGGTLINALKPLVKALNTAMSYIIAFAKTVSNALGKIFGWKYEDSSGGVTSDLEDAESAAGGVSDGLGSAADNAKKLKSNLLGIDELNVVEPDTDSGSSGGSGSGSGSSGSASASDGQWVQTDSIFKNFESELDSLYKLGDYIGAKLTDALNSINWEKVYEGARNFGTGLANFLNGLISPDLFGAVGRTIAGALNTAIYAALSFGQTFDFYDFGVSIATGINEFFETFDFASLAETLNTWVAGIKDSIRGFLDTITWESILNGMGDFLGDLELDTVTVIAGALLFKWGKGVTKATVSSAIAKGLGLLLGADTVSALAGVGGGVALTMSVLAIADLQFVDKTKREDQTTSEAIVEREERINATNYVDSDSFFEVFSLIKKKWTETFGTSAENEERINATNYVDSKSFTDTFNAIKEKIKTTWGNLKLKIETKVDDFKKKVSEKWDSVVKYWKGKKPLEEIQTTYQNLKDKVSEKWNEVVRYWKTKTSLSEVKTTYEDFKKKVSDKWSSVISYWRSKTSLSKIEAKVADFKTSVQTAWNKLRTWWNNNKPSLSEITAKIKMPHIKVGWDTTGFAAQALQKLGLKGFPNFSVEYYYNGGFPSKSSLFFAGENGVPEMLGTVGGRTAVASGAEITGIRDAVIQSSYEEMQLMREQNELLRMILEKDPAILGDKEIYKASVRGAKSFGKPVIV